MKDEKFEGHTFEAAPIDVTKEFMAGVMEFMEFLSENKNVQKAESLEIHPDLTHITDRIEFQMIARRVKAFLETQRGAQKREASIRCTRQQQSWEYNVFASGVTWDEAIDSAAE